MNVRQLSAARKRLAIVAHASDCTVGSCQRCAHALTLDTLETTREQLHETLRRTSDP